LSDKETGENYQKNDLFMKIQTKIF